MTIFFIFEFLDLTITKEIGRICFPIYRESIFGGEGEVR